MSKSSRPSLCNTRRRDEPYRLREAASSQTTVSERVAPEPSAPEPAFLPVTLENVLKFVREECLPLCDPEETKWHRDLILDGKEYMESSDRYTFFLNSLDHSGEYLCLEDYEDPFEVSYRYDLQNRLDKVFGLQDKLYVVHANEYIDDFKLVLRK